MKCEQNCGLDATTLIYDAASSMFLFLCDAHENDVARIEGEEQLDEVDLRYSTPQEISNFMNNIIAEKDRRYYELLKDFSAQKQQPEQVGSTFCE